MSHQYCARNPGSLQGNVLKIGVRVGSKSLTVFANHSVSASEMLYI